MVGFPFEEGYMAPVNCTEGNLVILRISGREITYDDL